MAKLLHEDEYAALLADAERYRFIRAQCEGQGGLLNDLIYGGLRLCYTHYGNIQIYQLDQTIDLLRGK